MRYAPSSRGLMMEEERERGDGPREQFAQLRPVCVALMQERSVEAVKGVQDVVSMLGVVHPHLLEYVLLPLRTTLHRSSWSDGRLLEVCLNCLSDIVSRTSLSSRETFGDLFTMVCVLLDDGAPDKQLAELHGAAGKACRSEELCIAALGVLQCLLLNCDLKVLSHLHGSLAMLGHGVSVVLQQLQRWNARDCRTTALCTLLSFTGRCGSLVAEAVAGNGGKGKSHSEHAPPAVSVPAGSKRSCLQSSLGHGEGGTALASFLPGICTLLYKLATSGVHTGQMVISLSLLSWAHFIALCAGGDVEGKVEGQVTGKKQEEEEQSLAVKRDLVWLRDTDSKLAVLAAKLSSLAGHESWRVQIAVVQWAGCLLMHCHRSLPLTSCSTLEALVSLRSGQCYRDVNTAAQSTLDQFSVKVEAESSGSVQGLLEERLYSLASSLPATMRNRDELGKMRVLRLVRGYLEVLGSRVAQFTCSLPHLSRLTQALLQTVKLDPSDGRIAETGRGNSQLQEVEDDSWSLPLAYVHIRDEAVEREVYEICQLLGRQGDAPVLLDHLLDLSSSTALRAECFILLRHVLDGVALRTPLQQEVVSAVQVVVEEVSGGEFDLSQKKILQNCLLMQVLAGCADVLREEFGVLLQQVVFPVMARMGSEHHLVSCSAKLAAQRIARAVGHSSIQELIGGSADYLLDSVSLYLHHQRNLFCACPVLKAVIKYSSAQLLPVLSDSRAELLLCLDQNHSPELIWPVLHSFAVQLSCWLNEGKQRASSTGDLTSEQPGLNCGQMVEFFIDYHARKQQLKEEKLEEEKEEEVEEAVASPSDWAKEELSPGLEEKAVVEVAVDILQRCTHHLSCHQLEVCHCVLDCLRLCLHSLKHHEDVLLPEVHTVWPAFVPCLSHSTASVKLKSLEVLLVMSVVSKTFLRRRAVDTVWPLLIESMQSLSVSCQNEAVCNPVYGHTVEYKLQRKLLEVLGELCVTLEASSSDCEQIVRACLPYLSRNMPVELQDTCVHTISVVASQHADSVWLLLAQMCSPSSLPSPPHNSFTPIKLPTCSRADQYHSNVHTLMRSLY